jgi:hypothetical protein
VGGSEPCLFGFKTKVFVLTRAASLAANTINLPSFPPNSSQISKKMQKIAF